MRRQSGTTDLRALLYMDEVAGYLPPTADAADEEADHDADEAGARVRRRRRALDAEPGRRRLQGDLERRHVDDRPAADRAGQGPAARRDDVAAGDVDVAAIGDTITGLGKREFVLRRAGKDQPEVFTTRWAMSYLRGPLTRDQIGMLTSAQASCDPELRHRATHEGSLPRTR